MLRLEIDNLDRIIDALKIFLVQTMLLKASRRELSVLIQSVLIDQCFLYNFNV